MVIQADLSWANLGGFGDIVKATPASGAVHLLLHSSRGLLLLGLGLGHVSLPFLLKLCPLDAHLPLHVWPKGGPVQDLQCQTHLHSMQVSFS